jgi:hypothetical protein
VDRRCPAQRHEAIASLSAGWPSLVNRASLHAPARARRD